MSKKFEFKLTNKSVKLNLKSFEMKKLVLKFIGIHGTKKTKFYAKINIRFNSDINNINNAIKNINIEELKIDDIQDEKISKCKYNYFYVLCSSSSSSSDSSCISSSEIYNNIMLFIKNIKLSMNDNKLESVIFSLKNTNIKKIKVKGKIYQ
jgi:hypothetical protein